MSSVYTIVCIILCLIILWITSVEKFSTTPDSIEKYVFDSGKPGIKLCIIAGTHGNEPAGTIALRDLLSRNMIVTPPTGSITVLPCVNVWGTANNQRWLFNGGWAHPNGDLNRNYHGPISSMSYIAAQVATIAAASDIILDFHEGWGYHKCQPSSVGSSLAPTGDIATNLSNIAVAKLNATIDQTGCKGFSVLRNQSCDIGSTLGCYMQKMGKQYILVEITGQNDIQPISIRMQQAQTIIAEVIFLLW